MLLMLNMIAADAVIMPSPMLPIRRDAFTLLDYFRSACLWYMRHYCLMFLPPAFCRLCRALAAYGAFVFD